jgi:hypothetical protein
MGHSRVMHHGFATGGGLPVDRTLPVDCGLAMNSGLVVVRSAQLGRTGVRRCRRALDGLVMSGLRRELFMQPGLRHRMRPRAATHQHSAEEPQQHDGCDCCCQDPAPGQADPGKRRSHSFCRQPRLNHGLSNRRRDERFTHRLNQLVQRVGVSAPEVSGGERRSLELRRARFGDRRCVG